MSNVSDPTPLYLSEIKWSKVCSPFRGRSRQQLVLIACDIARLCLHLLPKGEDRPRVAIETAEAWARGEATRERVIQAYEIAEAALNTALHFGNTKSATYYAAWTSISAALSDFLGGSAFDHCCDTAHYATEAGIDTKVIEETLRTHSLLGENE